MGCGGSSPAGGNVDSDEFMELDILKEPEDEVITIEEQIESYPKPKPPPNKKRHIFTTEDGEAADKRAKQIKAEDVSSIDQLALQLTKGLSNDVQQLRALFMWMGIQQMSTRPLPSNSDSPLVTMMRKVKEKKMSYTTFFTILCRAVNIPCNMIRGLAKSVAYEVGDQDVDGCTNLWTAVYVAGGWRFVFPLWAFSAISGFQAGKWTLVETEGKGVRQREMSSEGITFEQVNDYYFLTDPERFIYACYPYDPSWQLIPQPYTKRMFIDVPYCRPAFFTNNVKLNGGANCLLYSEEGACDISFKARNDLDLTYELYFNHKESKSPISEDIQLDRYVACMNQEGATNFRIRFPSEGIFKIEVYGSVVGSRSAHMLCAFKLICNENVADVSPFPCNPPLGFGPSALTLENGLAPQSHKVGFIHMKKEKNVNVKFTMTKNVQIQTVLVHNQIPSKDLQHHVKQIIVGNELNLDVNIPNSDEYALQINTKPKGSQEAFTNACNYLISSKDMDKKKKKRAYENAHEKRARKGLDDCFSSKDPETIQKALDEFQKQALEDPKKVAKAEQKMSYHTLANALKEAINTRNIDKLENSLKNAKSSEFSGRLNNLIESAEELLSHLKKLKKFSHDVLKMNKPTIAEITNYKNPHPVAYDIMKATYLLLNEREDHLEEWTDITSLMRKTGREGLLRRVGAFDTVNLSKDYTNKAAKMLNKYDEEQTKNTSVGIATFYIWGRTIIDDVITNPP